MSSNNLPQELLRWLLAADRQSANKMVDEWAAVNGYELAVTELLEPALELFGEQWQNSEDVSVAHAYIAGKTAEDILNKAVAARISGASVAPESKGPVVIGNIEDDYHSLGRKLVVTFLCASGWKVYDMGNDVPAEDFVDEAIRVGARVVGASAMMYSNAMNIKKLRAEIDRRNLTDKIKLAVGGAVFVLRPELVEEVGGDGTARNAFCAPDLMTRLWNEAGGDENE